MASLAEVTAPQNEEGTKATILKWCKTAGESILKDEPLLELETDKVTVEIPSPASGVLVEILKQPNEEVLPGQLLARVRTDAGGGAQNGAGSDAGAGGSPAASATAAALAAVTTSAGSTSAGSASVGSAKVGSADEDDGRQLLSPAVRRLLAENALTAADVRGSGRNGRITAQDVAHRLAAKPAPGRVPHTPIRRRVAEHMVRSLRDSPHVTTLFEADLTRV
ncbi:MAG TPA: biotin/lipoyl-containing protein, partial [Steroidobacteraceae bacterium]|nr:biotin/lipoyl-containing protein [Steroidobacteraceae bacterium]